MFKNVMVYRIGEGWNPSLAEVESALQGERFVECGATQDKSVGWTEPRGQEHGPLLESVGGQWIAKLMIESKAVPGSVVRRKLDAQVAEIEAATGRKPGKKEKRQMQDEILLSLLPQAFARQASVLVWVDLKTRRLVLDAGSQGKADEAVSALIKALPGLSLALLQTATTPQAAMTEWLLAPAPEDWPADLCVERECTLKATGEDAASIRYVRHPLANDEVRKHVTEGKLPAQLALSWDGRVAFVLTDTLQLKKVQFMDGVMDDSGTDKDEDRFDADVALSTGLLSPLLDGLVEALGGELEWGTTAASAASSTAPDAHLATAAHDDPPF
jgi:recombination associated protein RdgC